MNTPLDIVLWGINQELADKMTEKVFKRILEIQKILDRFNPEAETYQVNQTAFSKPVPVSAYLFQKIKKGIKDFYRSQGYFNIFAGTAYAVLKETGNRTSLSIPHYLPEEMIDMDESKSCIRFLYQSVSLDFGGIGKGLALDEASIIMDEFGIKNAFISFGGSSILTKGRHPHGDYWPFTFQNQEIEKEIWPLRNDAVSVSSAGQGSNNRPHILDPNSGLPPATRTTGVQSDSAAEAEVLSTTLIAAPDEKHQEIVRHFNVKKWNVF